MNPAEALELKIRDTEEALERYRRLLQEDPDCASVQLGYQSLQKWYAGLLEERKRYEAYEAEKRKAG